MLRRGQTITTLIALALTVALAACGGPSETAEPTKVGSKRPGAPADLTDTEWVLTSLNGSSLVEDSNITLAFAEGRLGGFAGCNSYGSQYTPAANGTLTISEIEITLQLCQLPEGVMEQEAVYIEALRDIAAYRVTDGRLEIENAAGETALVFVRKEEFEMNPDDLLGTSWQLVLMDGSRPIEESTITLAFYNEYQVVGHAECRGYVATYEASGDNIGFPWLAMMGTACLEQEALMEQEGQYTTVLEWATDYRLSEGRLEILTARGEVLVFEPLLEDAAASLEGTTWALTALIEEKTTEGMPTPLPMPTDLLPETEITATFEDGTVRGSAGCNTYGADYAVDESFLTFESIAVTEMACGGPAGIMEQETRYLRVLEDVTAYRIYGHQLWLETDDGRALVLAVKATGYSLMDLAEDLRAAGLAVELTKQPVDHGFAIRGRRLLANGAPVFVYQFAEVAAAETASAGVSADKYSITITRSEDGRIIETHGDWIETPHLYLKGRLIVIAGDDSDVLNALDAVLGPQFAGGRRDCTGPDAFPIEEAELIWPELREVQPDRVAPGDEVEILGVGGHLYWDNECGEFWLESARDFQLFFDGEPAGFITCYANLCVTDLTVPADAVSGTHIISVEGGSSLNIEVSGKPTPSPMPTPSPGPTNTSTPVPTPTEEVNVGPVIHYFRADVEEADPGDTIVLEWESSGGTPLPLTAILHHITASGQLPQYGWEVASSGVYTYEISPAARNSSQFFLYVYDEANHSTGANLTVRLRCPDAWFFSPAPAVCASASVLSNAAEQHFERGLMIWVEDTLWVEQESRIFVLYDDDQHSPKWEMFTDEWDAGEPDHDPALTPPAGLYQPVRGFGLVWRERPHVRDRLGWAIDQETGFSTIMQVTTKFKYNSTYLRALDGNVWHLGPEMSSWEKISVME